MAISKITGASIATGTITAAKLAADTATQAELDVVSGVANAALPRSGGAMTGAITTSSTIAGVDIATRNTANNAKVTNYNQTKSDIEALGIAASSITGALPAIDGGALTGLVSDPTMGGDLSGVASNAQLVDDSVDIATLSATGTASSTTFLRGDNSWVAVDTSTLLPKAGGAMTGAITTNSTFDGRDVATDGTKLDTIETNAKDDQTAAEILSAIKTVDVNGTSGINAGTADGLAITAAATRNDAANKVVTTQANGYCDFGWINTTSGGASGTPTRIYCSQDSYLRYYTPASLAPYLLNQGSTKNSHTHSYIPLSGGTVTGSLIGTTSTRNQSMIGSYSSYHTDQIWSMGSAYRNHASGTNFGNLYGLAYKHTNNSTGGTMGGGHMMVWCQNGTAYASLGTNIWSSGNITAYSDARVKENLEVIPNAVDKVKQLNGYTFDRTDKQPATPEEEDVIYDHNPTNRHVGVIAQEVLKVLPEAVTGGPNSNAGSEDEHYSVAYGNIVALLIEAIKEQQVQIDELKVLVGGK